MRDDVRQHWRRDRATVCHIHYTVFVIFDDGNIHWTKRSVYGAGMLMSASIEQ